MIEVLTAIRDRDTRPIERCGFWLRQLRAAGYVAPLEGDWAGWYAVVPDANTHADAWPRLTAAGIEVLG